MGKYTVHMIIAGFFTIVGITMIFTMSEGSLLLPIVLIIMGISGLYKFYKKDNEKEPILIDAKKTK